MLSFIASKCFMLMCFFCPTEFRQHGIGAYILALHPVFGTTLGCILGKQLFRSITTSAPNSDITQIIQSFILLILLIGTLIYTFRKKYIHAQQIHKSLPCLIIGLNLGCLSSFLGIGGGPINLVVLHYFFSMDTKTAAANSLYIILFSQAASLISTIMTGTTPELELISLVQMIGGGILGGICGRQISP